MNNNQSQRAVEFFSLNYNCAQSVYAACATSEGMSEAQRLALAAPFGGGVARQGEICGALTGALLALGEIEEKPWLPIPWPAGMLSTRGREN